MTPLDYDVVVVGAGVIGLACAERLSRAGRTLLLLERHSSFGRETSSRNSEVVHAGIYYASGSLKAELCVRGNAETYAWCERHGVACSRLGKLIVASSAEDEAELARLRTRAEQNGVPELRWLGAAEVAALEPNVIARSALFSSTSGVVDSHGLMASLLAAARERGVDVAWRHTLCGVEARGDGFDLRVRGGDGQEAGLSCRALVNAAGLDSDRVAALAGLDVVAAGYRQSYVKGSYFRIAGPAPVRHLVYPVPPPRLVGLGVHVTLDLAGSARLGPDVEPLAGRDIDYGVDELRAPEFLSAATRYLRGLTLAALAPDQSGVRPRLAAAPGEAPDFVVQEESARGLSGWVNLVGIESPGLTCALPIAERVARLLA